MEPGTEPEFSHRDLDILRMLLQGKEANDICRELEITPQTVSKTKSKFISAGILHQWYMDPRQFGFNSIVVVLTRMKDMSYTHPNLTRKAIEYFAKCRQLVAHYKIVHGKYNRLALFMVRDMDEFHGIEKEILDKFGLMVEEWLPLMVDESLKNVSFDQLISLIVPQS